VKRKNIYLTIFFLSLFSCSAVLYAQDSLNMRLVERFRNQMLEKVNDVVVVDDYAYVITDLNGLWVVDISDPEDLIVDVGHVFIPTVCIDISIVDTLLYISGVDFDEYPNNQWGIFIFSIANPTNPELVNTFLRAPFLVNNNDSLYAMSNSLEIFLLDISDAQNPSILSEIEFDRIIDGGIEFKDTVLYALDDIDRLISINIRNPRQPVFLDTLQLQEDSYGMHLEDSLIVIANGSNGISFVNCSDPENLSLITTIDYRRSIMSVKFVEEYVYAVSRNDNIGVSVSPDSIYIMSLENLQNPLIVDTIPVSHNLVPLNFDIVENFLYLSDRGDGMRIFDIEDAAHPEEIGTTDRPKYIKDTAISGDKLHALDRASVWTLDLSDPDDPYFLWKALLNPEDGSRIEVGAEYFWISTMESNLLKAEILAEPPWLSFVDTLEIFSGPGVSILFNRENEYIYFLVDGHFLGVFDVQAGSIVDTIDLDERFYTLAIGNDLLYLGTRNSSIYIFDLEDPAHPDMITFFELDETYHVDIEPFENFLYINSNRRILKVDMEDPTNPELVGTYEPEEFETEYKSGMYGPYFVCYEMISERILVLDLTSENPEEWGPIAWYDARTFYVNPGYEHSIDVVNGYIIDDFTVYQPFDMNEVSKYSTNRSSYSDVSISIFPNPFNESVSISYVIPQAGNIILSVYNLLGQQVAKVSERSLLPGSYEVNWTPSD